jgi:two-component system nitrate/nitrite sensor histidine kinase NarX
MKTTHTVQAPSLNEQLKQANELLNRQSAELAVRIEAERRQRMVAEGLQEILGVLNSERALDEILDYIVSLAARLLNGDACAVYTLGDMAAGVTGDEQLVVRAYAGFRPEAPPLSPIRMGEGAIGQSVALNVTVSMVDTDNVHHQHPEGGARQDEQPTDPFENQLRDGYQAIMAVPLKIADEIRGCLVLYYLYPMEIGDEAVALAMSFGTQITLALENARQRQEVQNLAVMQERARLARELHDSVTQSLYSLNLFAEAGRILAGQEASAKTQHYLTRIGETTQQALKEMRLLVYELRPLALENEGLVQAVRKRLDTVENRAGVTSRLVVDEEIRLPSALEPDLFRIINEALNNALKHAQAKNLVVGFESISADADPAITQPGTKCVEITVADDGRGLDLSSLEESGGLGMHSMRERAEQLGGQFYVTSAPGQGTTIRVRIYFDHSTS